MTRAREQSQVTLCIIIVNFIHHHYFIPFATPCFSSNIAPYSITELNPEDIYDSSFGVIVVKGFGQP